MTPLVPRGEAFRLWLKVGLTNFGGPAGQIALMHRLIVEEKRWIGETRFLQGLNYCMLLPGPEAQQLATYIGTLMGGVRGGLVAGGLFILPGALLMLLLSAVYALYAKVPVIDGMFYGIRAAVVAIVIEALLRIAKRALKTTQHRVVAGLSFAAIFVFAVPFPLIVLAAALFGAIAARGAPAAPPNETDGTALVDAAFAQGRMAHVRPSAMRALVTAVLGLAIWFAPLLVFRRPPVLADLGAFFAKMAVVTFGGAYAVLSYVSDQAVNVHHWLRPDEMLHGLGLAETTPGPLILVLQFVGFQAAYRAPGALSPMEAGIAGSLITLWATFVPSFLWIFVGLPYTEALRRVAALNGALASVTAAVVGVVLNLTVWFAMHALFARTVALGPVTLPDVTAIDPVAAVLAAAAALALIRFKVGLFAVMGAAAVLGILHGVLL
jgi:chromate transporter